MLDSEIGRWERLVAEAMLAFTIIPQLHLHAFCSNILPRSREIVYANILLGVQWHVRDMHKFSMPRTTYIGRLGVLYKQQGSRFRNAARRTN